MAICLGGKKKRKTGQEVNDIINLNISAACRISFVWSCLFVLITSLYGLVSKKNMETICSVEPNQFPHKPMIVDQEASHHRRANHTSPQHTLPYQTNDTLTIDVPTTPMQCHTMPCPSTPCNTTLYKDQGASPTLFLLTRRVSLLAVSFMCHLLICSPLKYPSLLV